MGRVSAEVRSPAKATAWALPAPATPPAANSPARLVQTRRQSAMTHMRWPMQPGLQLKTVNHLADGDRRIIRARLNRMIVKRQTQPMVGNLSSSGSTR